MDYKIFKAREVFKILKLRRNTLNRWLNDGVLGENHIKPGTGSDRYYTGLEVCALALVKNYLSRGGKIKDSVELVKQFKEKYKDGIYVKNIDDFLVIEENMTFHWAEIKTGFDMFNNISSSGAIIIQIGKIYTEIYNKETEIERKIKEQEK